MKTAQGISLDSYLYLKLTKMPCFSYYLLGLSSTKYENRFCLGARKENSVWGGDSTNNVYTCK
jgi:hypothetical protein